jgi:hypothetical protein
MIRIETILNLVETHGIDKVRSFLGLFPGNTTDFNEDSFLDFSRLRKYFNDQGAFLILTKCDREKRNVFINLAEKLASVVLEGDAGFLLSLSFEVRTGLTSINYSTIKDKYLCIIKEIQDELDCSYNQSAQILYDESLDEIKQIIKVLECDLGCAIEVYEEIDYSFEHFISNYYGHYDSEEDFGKGMFDRQEECSEFVRNFVSFEEYGGAIAHDYLEINGHYFRR